MAECNATGTTQARAIIDEVVELMRPQLEEMQRQLDHFRAQPVTPTAFFELEIHLQAPLRESGRALLQKALTELEPATREEVPLRVNFERETYRRRPKQPKTIYSTFGPLEYTRFRYEACERGERSLFPLDLLLGLEAHLATPALAECVGRLAVDHEQSQVLATLVRDHGVCWAVSTLRKVTATLSGGMASFREAAQVQKALDWLKKAFHSKGRHRPVLAVGRDGIMIPMRQQGYKEACTATLAIYDRNKKRLGTLYLGVMPEPGQETMTRLLTSLINKILAAWHAQNGDEPRLVYLTDGGYHCRDFFQRVLRKMVDPWRQDGSKLGWQWILDYWHVCGYVNKMAIALFGDGAKAHQWFRRMRRWLRDRTNGITQVLRSASQHQTRGHLSKAREEAFLEAYRFLRKNWRRMRYASYRRQGTPIGSGVTEAACKTVFTQRLKRSGMSWRKESGQVIVDLRILHLSGIWNEVYTQYLRTRPLPIEASGKPFLATSFRKAA
jgi:hypothetical protein